LDDPAVAYLPELRKAVSPFAAIETVTIRRMLSHESGLATEPPGTDWSVPLYQGAPEVTLAQAGDIVLTLPPNRQHKYSDIAYQLLGEIVTRVSGTPYPLYVQESILDPLSMSATAFEPLEQRLLDRRATGYDWRTVSDQLDPAPAMSPVWAEGGLWSCADDMARWLSFQLRAYRQLSADSSVLSAASLREMHKPATWPTMTGLVRGASPGARTATITSPGSSTPEDCRDSPAPCASIPGSRSELSS
jgi:CubicO group peptidase (beta-lactamase class C family)